MAVSLGYFVKIFKLNTFHLNRKYSRSMGAKSLLLGWWLMIWNLERLSTMHLHCPDILSFSKSKADPFCRRVVDRSQRFSFSKHHITTSDEYRVTIQRSCITSCKLIIILWVKCIWTKACIISNVSNPVFTCMFSM